ncbi:methyltransferase [Thermodesulfobacteriota bacterium]
MSEKSDKEINPTTIMRHASAVIPAFAMLAGMQLDVFTPLKDGPMNTEALAKALDVKANKLSPLLYALVMADLLSVKDGLFSNTDEANRFLVSGSPGYMGGLSDYYSRRWHAVLQSAETISTGKPQAKIDWKTLDEDQLFEILRGLHPNAIKAGSQLAKKIDFSGFKHLLDAGGGTGGLAIGLCESCHNLMGTVVELPTVVPVSKRFVSEAQMSDRIKVFAADLLDDPPEGTYDVAVLRAFIQTLSSKHAKAVLKNIGKTMEPGGCIYILGYVIDDTRLYPESSVAWNLHFLNIYDDGQAFTENQYQSWLDEAGFTDVSIEYNAMPQGMAIVCARKA